MTLQQLLYILAVERYRNFNRAARACGVSQPSLSIQIKALENELGVSLFDRAKTGVRVTDIGKATLAHARDILARVQQLEDECQSFRGELRGTLRVGFIPTVGPYLLPFFLDRLRKNSPLLTLEIFEETTQGLIESIRENALDAAVLSTPRESPENVLERLLYYEPFVLYASKNHPLLKQKALGTTDLAKHSITLLHETHCLRDQVLSACGGKVRESEGEMIRLSQGSLQTLVSIVESTGSFTLLPVLAEPYLHLRHRRSGLRHLDAKTPHRKISLVYSRNFGRRSLVEALHAAIRAGLPPSIALNRPTHGTLVEPGERHFM